MIVEALYIKLNVFSLYIFYIIIIIINAVVQGFSVFDGPPNIIILV